MYTGHYNILSIYVCMYVCMYGKFNESFTQWSSKSISDSGISGYTFSSKAVNT